MKVDRLDGLDLGSSLDIISTYLIYLSISSGPQKCLSHSVSPRRFPCQLSTTPTVLRHWRPPGSSLDASLTFPACCQLLDNGRGRPTTSTANLNHKNTLDHHPLSSPQNIPGPLPDQEPLLLSHDVTCVPPALYADRLPPCRRQSIVLASSVRPPRSTPLISVPQKLSPQPDPLPRP
ncbi:hypothetical protein VTN00DRAFT_4130 [Thermoascus crustaceus]|uniref:uncharacterized protein n=1 Tax=Thermoascus crustaceus TaxID=5088 RepID=UPI003744079A